MALPLAAAMGLGALIGLIKGGTVDAAKERQSKAMEAAKARWSPWTGLKPDNVQYANPMGSAMGGALAAGSFAEGLRRRDAYLAKSGQLEDLDEAEFLPSEPDSSLSTGQEARNVASASPNVDVAPASMPAPNAWYGIKGKTFRRNPYRMGLMGSFRNMDYAE